MHQGLSSDRQKGCQHKGERQARNHEAHVGKKGKATIHNAPTVSSGESHQCTKGCHQIGRKAANTKASGKPGITRLMLVRRARQRSTTPPLYPAVSPTNAPRAVIRSEERLPTQRRAASPESRGSCW